MEVMFPKVDHQTNRILFTVFYNSVYLSDKFSAYSCLIFEMEKNPVFYLGLSLQKERVLYLSFFIATRRFIWERPSRTYRRFIIEDMACPYRKIFTVISETILV